ncbi:hypothetical protein JTE90_013397 [Oedothorax gibbosus]|uniref:DUF4806 domain-containing protein n=1 Tax=Oedothorax gibbosus TaxID=931172 RepID=A0AAV6TWP0_9ARAC|nr:hypothetical protein JTE90_013397 [Oedothorax gibbosus]
MTFRVKILYQSTALRVVLAKLQGIEEKQAQVLSLLQQTQDVCLPVSSDDLPVHFMENLKLLDEKLADDSEFAKLVKILGFRGGKDVADCTRKVLSGLMTTGLARQLNWRGGQIKTSITDTTLILQLIFVSVRQNKEFQKATQEEMEGTVKTWLRSACDRDGGRAKRRKTIVSPPEESDN